MEQMDALDASFLDVEDAVSHMHIGSIGLFEGPAPSQEQLRAMLLGKLALVPRYRQVVRLVPLSMGRPVWVDDLHFNLDYHLRRTGLPAPGGDEQLRPLVARIMSQQLDRSKPLWEMWIVEGLDGGRWALISKIHHCMVDGVAGTDLILVMLDQHPTAAPPAEDTWTARAPPGARAALREGDPRQPDDPVAAAARALPERASRARRLARRSGTRSDAPAGVTVPPPRSSLNGPLGPHRRWTWARAQLAEIKAGASGTWRDRQRRRARVHHRRLPRLLIDRGRVRRSRGAHACPRVGSLGRRAAGLQQPRLGHVRRPAGGLADPRRSGSHRSVHRWRISSSPTRPSPVRSSPR